MSCYSDRPAHFYSTSDDRVALAPVDWLKAHEQCDYSRYLEVFMETARSRGYRWPIVVDYETGVILDGHHRFQVALTLGLQCVPAVFVDYLQDDRIRVRLWNSAGEPSHSNVSSCNSVLHDEDNSNLLRNSTAENDDETGFVAAVTPPAVPTDDPEYLSSAIPTSSSWSLLVDNPDNTASLVDSTVAPPPSPSDIPASQSISSVSTLCDFAREQDQCISQLAHGNGCVILPSHGTSTSHMDQNEVVVSRQQRVPASQLRESSIVTTNSIVSGDSPLQISRSSIEHLTKEHWRRTSAFFAPVATLFLSPDASSHTPVDTDGLPLATNKLVPKWENSKSARPSVITKSSVIAMGLSSDLFPPKTTKHFIPSSLYCSNVFFPLHQLMPKP